MSEFDFRRRLRDRDLLLGTLLTLPATALLEAVAGLGFDWLFLDAEHGGFTRPNLPVALKLIGGAVPCLVRIPELDDKWIRSALDAGADGVIVPLVDTEHDAERAVRHVDGRGVLVIQAESANAILNIESIARVGGIDAILIGPNDLSASLGIARQFDHPRFLRAVDAISRACDDAGVPKGIFGSDASRVLPYVESRFTPLVAGVDTALFADAARGLLDRLRG